MDQYRVVGTDGKEFGPVDLAGLQQWVREGRVLKDTRVRKNDGAAVMAELLPELASTFTPPPAGSTVPPIAMTVPLPGEFRIWGFIDQGWQLVKPHWVPLSVMFLIMTVIGAIPYLGGCVMLIIGQALYVGINRAILGMLAGRTPTIEMMFSGFDRFGQAFAAGLVMGILTAIGFLCLIVPGIILAIMWMFTNLVIAETDQDFWTAMQTSANLTKGYRWQLFGLLLACFLVGLLGVLACCIGIVVAEAVIFTAIALAYRFLQARNGTAKTA
jgi:uncharacterized membrane protein